MSDLRVQVWIVPDDGRAGLFWRDGRLWIRDAQEECPVPVLDYHRVLADQVRAITDRAREASRRPQ